MFNKTTQVLPYSAIKELDGLTEPGADISMYTREQQEAIIKARAYR